MALLENIKNWWKKVTYSPPNDWRYVYTLEGMWNDIDWGIKTYCQYTIWYSPSRRQLRLETAGDKPYKHRQYQTAKLWFQHYINEYRQKGLID